jgi:excisionase family DNA binding protein
VAESTSQARTRAAYTVEETRAALGGVSRDYLYRLIRNGELKSQLLGGRRLIPASELERIARGEAVA